MLEISCKSKPCEKQPTRALFVSLEKGFPFRNIKYRLDNVGARESRRRKYTILGRKRQGDHFPPIDHDPRKR
jgi:hypothetical protein